MFGDQSREPQSGPVFQAHRDQRALVIIAHHGPDPVVHRRIDQTSYAKAIIRTVEGQRQAASCAPRLCKKIELSPARQTEPVVRFHGNAAQGTSWRQGKIDQRLQNGWQRHLIFLSSAPKAARLMTDTVNVPEVFNRKRRRIVRDRAYARANGDDFLSQIMAEEILERLDVVKRTFRRVLIIGLPADKLRQELQARGMKVVFADSSTMIVKSLGGVICDDDRLPFADHSFDLIINIGSLDTVNDLPGALVLLRRILVPDGLLLAAMISAESFPSLKSVIMQAEGDRVSAHIHPQIDVRTAGDLLARAGLTMPVADSDSLRLRYSGLQRLISDIRDVGGSNILSGNVSAIGRNVYNRIRSSFADQVGADGKFSESVAILYLCAWAPHPDQPKPAPRGSGQESLATTLSRRSESETDN